MNAFVKGELFRLRSIRRQRGAEAARAFAEHVIKQYSQSLDADATSHAWMREGWAFGIAVCQMWLRRR